VIRRVLIGAALAALAAPAARAQPSTATGGAFLTGLRACVANMQGELALDAPSPAQDAAGLVLADPAGTGALKHFSDLSPRQRRFASVKGGAGNVVIAADPSQRLCRVVVLNVVSVLHVTSTVGPLSRDWVATVKEPNFTVYSGSIEGSPRFAIQVRTPRKGGAYGDAAYILTLLPAQP
jgi:hypothetical protein